MNGIVAIDKAEKTGRINHLWEKVTGACTAAFVALTASNSFAAETVTDLFTEVTTQTAGAKNLHPVPRRRWRVALWLEAVASNGRGRLTRIGRGVFPPAY
jgi:hypothetical protein